MKSLGTLFQFMFSEENNLEIIPLQTAAENGELIGRTFFFFEKTGLNNNTQKE